MWAIGDAAAGPRPRAPRSGAVARRPLSTTMRQGRVVARENIARSAGLEEEPKKPFKLQDPRRLRGHGPLPGGRRGRSASAGAASRRGFSLAPYHLARMPGQPPARAARDGLDRRAAVRPRHLGAGPARASAAARAVDRAGGADRCRRHHRQRQWSGACARSWYSPARRLHAIWNTLLADAEDTHASTAVRAARRRRSLFAPVAALTWNVDGRRVAVHRRPPPPARARRTSRCWPRPTRGRTSRSSIRSRAGRRR